jgi:hypothetical protein
MTLSDHLRPTRTQSGRNNLPSEVLFIAALSAAGLRMIGSSASWKVIAGSRGKGARLGATAQAFGILSGGVMPWRTAHNGLVKATFLL